MPPLFSVRKGKEMQEIDVSEVVVEERVRKHFDEKKIQELKDSILEKGLYHPIVLQDDSSTLVMGERRLRAIRSIYEEDETFYHNGQPVTVGHVPYSILSEMENYQILEAELEENILRDDLEWQERAEATRRLHEMRVSQYGEANHRGSGWSVTDTASEIRGEQAKGSQVSRVQRDLTLADHLDDPMVAAAKDEKEALKIIEREKKREHRRQQAEEASTSNTSHSLLQADSLETLKTFEDASFDIIITDPPYGIDVHKDKQRDGEYHEYDDSPEYLDQVAQALAEEGFRICKQEAHLYMFCDIRQWPSLAATFFVNGWDVWERPLIWYKGNTGSFGGTDWGPRRTYEAILYAAKGRRPVTALYHDVIDVPKPTQTEHPAAKPVEVYENLLRRSANPGDRVLDPFCGGGPVFEASEKFMAIATGIELNDDYYALAHENLRKINE